MATLMRVFPVLLLQLPFSSSSTTPTSSSSSSSPPPPPPPPHPYLLAAAACPTSPSNAQQPVKQFIHGSGISFPLSSPYWPLCESLCECYASGSAPCRDIPSAIIRTSQDSCITKHVYTYSRTQEAEVKPEVLLLPLTYSTTGAAEGEGDCTSYRSNWEWREECIVGSSSIRVGS